MIPTVCFRCGRVLGYDLPDDLIELVTHHDCRDPQPLTSIEDRPNELVALAAGLSPGRRRRSRATHNPTSQGGKQDA